MAEVVGLQVGELPEGWQPVEAVAVVVCLSPDVNETGPASMRMSTRATESLSLWDAVGMLRCAIADLEQQYIESLEQA